MIFTGICMFILIIFEAFIIHKQTRKIEDSDRLKKEIYKLGDSIALIDNKQDAYDLILGKAIDIIKKGSKGSIVIKGKDNIFRYKSLRGFGEEHKRKSYKLEELHLYKYNRCKRTAIINYYEGKRNEILKKSILVAPINFENKLLGLISIDGRDKKFTEDDVNTMKYIRNELELVIKNIIVKEQLKDRAIHDELTNLYNRRKFNEVFDNYLCEIDGKSEEGHLALIDLDNFKKINDNYGHSIGDKALIIMANAMKDTLLDTESLYGRLSGDEFVILFKGVSEECAYNKMNGIRDYLDSLDNSLNIGFSFGLVSFSGDNRRKRHDIFSDADKKMYESKKLKNVARE